MSDVSLTPGHESIAKPSVTAAIAPSRHSSSPILFSQYRGPHIFNMAETDEERKKREEDERKKAEDDEKKSNFQKVKEAREEAEKRATAAEAKLKEIEDAEKKKQEQELKDKEQFKTLADQKEKEASEEKAKADAATKRAEDAEAKLQKIAEEQEKELTALLETIPKEKQPPLDPTDPVEKRLSHVKYAATLLNIPKPPVGAPLPKTQLDSKTRLQELLDIQKKRPLTEEESEEMMSLGE